MPWRVAAPSWVTPGTAAENCRLLARYRDRFDEVTLLCFESQGSLAYTDADLPPAPAESGLSFHVHLPSDLDWSRGAAAPAKIILDLAIKLARLAPRVWVLHPPDDPALLAPLAQALSAGGIAPRDVLLENIRGNDLTHAWPEAFRHGYSICLDLGHLLAYGQNQLLEIPRLFERVRMLHCCAPGEGGRHRSLAWLDPQGCALLLRLLARLAPDATLTIEVFDLAGCLDSYQVLTKLVSGGRTS